MAAVLLVIAAVLLACPGGVAAREWSFDVTADGIPIGTYHVDLNEDGSRRHVVVDSRYRVRLLVLDAYSYEQHDEETWDGDCVVRLETRTIEHGKTTNVSAQLQDDALVVEGAGGRETLPRCSMTFAWWNPRIFTASALINTQTGALTPVTITALGADTIAVRGAEVDATRYRVETPRTVTEVWYSPAHEWLALRATTRSGGHVLSYRLK